MSANGGSYGKVWDRFWPEAKRAKWSSDMVVLGLYLLTCRHHVAEGIYYIPKGYIAADLGWETRRTDDALQALRDDGFARYDEDAEVVLLPSALRYNRPDNEKHVKGVVNKLRALPETPLLQEFLEIADAVDDRVSNGYRNSTDFSSSRSSSKELMPSSDGREEACVKNTHAAKKENPLTPDFLDWWTAWGKRGSRADAALCYAFWIARGASPADLLTAARNYLADCRRCERKQKDGATFLAKKPNRWEEWLERGDVDQRQKYRHPDGTVRYQDDDSLVPCET